MTQHKPQFNEYFRWGAGIALTVMIMSLGWLWTRIQIVEERQYAMQGQMVTKAELKEVKEEITSYVDKGFSNMRTDIQQVSRQIDFYFQNQNRKDK